MCNVQFAHIAFDYGCRLNYVMRCGYLSGGNGYLIWKSVGMGIKIGSNGNGNANANWYTVTG